MKLKLNRPIAFFDCESTGKDPKTARVIELGIIRLYPDGHTDSFCGVFNPEENISDDNAAIHGFTNEMVADKPVFKAMAVEVAEILKNCDLGGFNSNAYDIPLLIAEFGRAGVKLDLDGVEFIDAGNIFKILAPRTLSAAVLQYLGKDHAGAHGAIADTQATIEVLNAMIDRHGDDLPVTAPELALKSNYDRNRLDIAGKFAYDDKGDIVYTFGKSKGIAVQSDPGFARWMLGKKEENGSYSFDEDTRTIAESLTNGGRPLSDGKPNRVYVMGVLPKHAPGFSSKPSGKY